MVSEIVAGFDQSQFTREEIPGIVKDSQIYTQDQLLKMFDAKFCKLKEENETIKKENEMIKRKESVTRAENESLKRKRTDHRKTQDLLQ